MIVTNPIALWLILLIPIIILAYLLKRKIRNLTVCNLYLWDHVFEQKNSSWRFELRHVVSMLLALLIALTIIGAILKPTTRKRINNDIVVVIDNSASMNTVEQDGKTRFEHAMVLLKNIISNKEENQRMLLMTSGGDPEIVSGFTDNYSVLREKMGTLFATERPCRMAEALQLSKILTRQMNLNSTLYILTDGCFENAETLIDSNKSEENKWCLIGNSQNNIGITRFAARRNQTGTNVYEVLIKVMNFGTSEIQCDLEIDLDGAIVDIIPMTIGKGDSFETVQKYSSNDGGVLHAVISDAVINKDCLKCDNEAWSILASLPTLNVLYYGERNSYLESAILSQDNSKLIFAEKLPSKIDTDSILVVHRQVPQNIPEGKILIVNPQNSTSHFTVSDIVKTSLTEVMKPESLLMRSVRLDKQGLSGGRILKMNKMTFADVYADSADTPLILTTRKDSIPDSEQIILNFSCLEDNLYLRTVFPILLCNACSCLRKKYQDDSQNFRMCDSLNTSVLKTLGSIDCRDTNGNEIKYVRNHDNISLAAPVKTGVINITNSQRGVIRQLAVNLCSEVESNVAFKNHNEIIGSSQMSHSAIIHKPLWLILTIVALVLLIVEWYCFQRRIVE